MKRKADPVTRAQHRKIAADLFNYTWSLLDRKDRDAEEDEEMVHAAHGSRYHWAHAGTALHTSIGDWQLSRVYATLGRAEPALHHARRCLEVTRRHRFGRFYLAYAYEGMARAASVANDRRGRNRYLREARRVGVGIRDRDDRRMLFEDLETIR